MKLTACDIDHGLSNWEKTEAKIGMNIDTKRLTPELREIDLDVYGEQKFPVCFQSLKFPIIEVSNH